MKNLILIIGAPGSGKTTVAGLLREKYPQKIAHYSTGELLREEAKSGSELGEIISKRINAGELVPVEVAIDTIAKAIKKSDKNLILIDGIPRSMEQLFALESMLKKNSDISLKFVIEVVVSKKIALQRVLGRNRGDDDKVEVFEHRMRVYEEPLKGIEEFYSQKNLLVKIDGSKELENVISDMEKIISEFL